MHNTYFLFLQFPFFIGFISLVVIIGIKPAPGDHESNLKKVGAIPSKPKFNNPRIVCLGILWGECAPHGCSSRGSKSCQMAP